MKDKSLFDNKKLQWCRLIKENTLHESVSKSLNSFTKMTHYTIKDACFEMLPKKTLSV